MLNFDMQVPAGQKVTPVVIDSSARGTAFPSSPSHLDVFEMLEGGTSAAGIYVYNSRTSGWVLESRVSFPYDIGFMGESSLSVSAILMRILPVRALMFPAAFAGSRAVSSTAASKSDVFTINLNGTQIGTITFASGATVGTFTGPTAALIVGTSDVLTIVAPATEDTELTGVTLSILGSQLVLS